MDTTRLKTFCSRFPAAQASRLGEPQNVLLYQVGGKTFAYFKTSEPERWRFSFRVTPERFVELTDVPGIKPARWMGRWRWVTVVDVRRVPEDYPARTGHVVVPRCHRQAEPGASTSAGRGVGPGADAIARLCRLWRP
jgi:predicted DNA-binding protein (MmcQ/YjbR family)